MLEWIKSLFVDSETSRTAKELAERGENLAARHLQSKGYKILLRNFKTEMGELDIIAKQGKTLVFVEVKTRENDHVAPEDQVNAEKQQRVVAMAKLYLSRYGIPQPEHRFDIVAILWPPGRKPRIEHFEAAF